MWSKQFQTVDDIPKEYFKQNKVIFGVVEKVIDGDTIRIRHSPFLRPRRRQESSVALSYRTLSVRLYGIDTPEISRRKAVPSQEFAKDAQEFVRRRLDHRFVKLTILRKDQYRRAVCKVELIRRPFRTLSRFLHIGGVDMSILLAKRGLAEIYEGGGAEYCGNKSELERCVARAKAQRRGIWSKPDRVSAAEFKKHKKSLCDVKKKNSVPVLQGRKKRKGCRDVKKKTSVPVLQGRKQKKGHLLEAAVTGLELIA